MIAAPIMGAGFALSTVAQAIKGLYQIVGEIDKYIDEHIETLKRSGNALVSSTGQVLEGAKYGFGLGYMSSVAIIAVGQCLLGNTLSAVATVASAAILTNPIAMTCGAVGAIYYGWNALSNQERAQILERLSIGLSMGVELIRSLVDFVTRKTKELLTSSQLDDVKEFVKTQAALFGRSLYDVTHKIGDLVKGGVERTGSALKEGADKAGEMLKDGTEMAGEILKDGAEMGGEVLKDVAEKVGKLTGRASKSLARSGSQTEGSTATPPSLGEAVDVNAATNSGRSLKPS